jgi:hypothetical protein
LIEINLDVDWGPLTLTSLLAHEAYPGHHTEHQIKERDLLQSKGYFEECCILLFTPRSIIGEGIAETSLEIISSERDIFSWISYEMIPALSLPECNPEELFNKYRSGKKLRNSSRNAAILYNTGEINEDDAIEYLITYGLLDKKRAKQTFRFAADPFWKTYVIAYTEGFRLIEEAVQGKDKLPLFERLLKEQLLPEDLIELALRS